MFINLSMEKTMKQLPQIAIQIFPEKAGKCARLPFAKKPLQVYINRDQQF